MSTHADQGSRFQVGRVLGLVPEVRATVLHLRDARVRVWRMLPVRVATLQRAGAIESRQIRPC